MKVQKYQDVLVRCMRLISSNIFTNLPIASILYPMEVGSTMLVSAVAVMSLFDKFRNADSNDVCNESRNPVERIEGSFLISIFHALIHKQDGLTILIPSKVSEGC